MTSSATLSVEVVRYTREHTGSVTDWLSVEEPLEIRLCGETLAVTMRTPGHDHELAAGFLLGEGLIRSSKDLGSLRHCGRPDNAGYGNALDVLPAPGHTLEVPEAAQRRTLISSACGMCGRRAIDDLLERSPELQDTTQLEREVVVSLAQSLLQGQPNFSRTGGLHAAAIADSSGRFELIREDVGRHNAVDKVLGRLLLDDALSRQGRVLVVSGRASFEIVQKAVMAGVACVISISAPTSLAVATAKRTGVLLIGFAREGRFNVYHGAERILTS